MRKKCEVSENVADQMNAEIGIQNQTIEEDIV